MLSHFFRFETNSFFVLQVVQLTLISFSPSFFINFTHFAMSYSCFCCVDLAHIQLVYVLFSLFVLLSWYYLKRLYQARHVMKYLDGPKLDAVCTTEIDRFAFIWGIDNFRRFCEQEDLDVNLAMVSPTFGPVSSSAGPLQFRLDMYAFDPADDESEYVAVYLNLVGPNQASQVNVLYSFSILDRKGHRHNIKSNELPEKFVVGTVQGFREFIDRYELLENELGLLVNDRLTVHCEVILESGWSWPDQTATDQSNSADSLKYDTLFGEDTLSDVLLVAADGSQHSASKGVIATQSMALAQLLDQNEGTLKLDQVDKEVMQQLLQFVYTDKVTSLDKFASKLLPLAFEFQMDSLKSLCEQSVCSQLTTDSMISLLGLAEIYDCAELKLKVLQLHAMQTLNTIENTADDQLLVDTFSKIVLETDNDISV